MTTAPRLFAMFLLLVCGSGTSHAAVLEFGGLLDGAEEVPGVSTPGNGLALLLFDDATKVLTWSVSFHDLTGVVAGAPAAGVYHAAAGSTGPLAFAIDAGLINGSGATEGMFFGFTSIAPAIESALLAGHLYLNLHTTAHPGGEVRTQLLPATVTVVPLPAAAWLFLGGLGGTWRLARRRG
ncbi:MAG: CHRD domain-containing protein [Gammaproteobacteria bacterium]